MEEGRQWAWWVGRGRGSREVAEGQTVEYWSARDSVAVLVLITTAMMMMMIAVTVIMMVMMMEVRTYVDLCTVPPTSGYQLMSG